MLRLFVPVVIALFVLSFAPLAAAQESDLITGEFIRTYPVIKPLGPKVITENVVGPAGTPIHEMVIDVTRTLVQVRIDVRPLDPDEAELEVLPGGVVLSYINISAKNMDNPDLNRLDIKYRVNKTWMEENGIEGNGSVSMLRLNPGAWVELENSAVSQDDDQIYYETYSDSLGIFAVVGESSFVPEQPDAPVEAEVIGEQPEVVEVGSGQEYVDARAREELAVIVGVAIVVVTVAVLFLLPGSVLRRKASRR